MKSKFKLSLLLSFFAALVLALSGCSDDPSSLGKDQLAERGVGVIDTALSKDTNFVKAFSFRPDTALQLGSSNYLLVGKVRNVEAWTLMRFYPDVSSDSYDLDSMSIVSARVKLTYAYKAGDTTSFFEASVHRITGGWSPYTFTADSLAYLPFSSSIGTITDSISSETTTFAIDKSVIMDWFKLSVDTSYTTKNYGILIKPNPNCKKVVGFQALTSSSTTEAELQVIVEKANNYNYYLDTLTFNVLSDAHIVKGTEIKQPQRMTIQSGLPSYGKVWFDISQIPAGVVLNNAELILHCDTTQNLHGTTMDNELLAYYVSDSAASTVNSSYYTTLGYDTGSYTATVTNIVSKFMAEKKNINIKIFPTASLDGVDITSIYSHESTDPKLRPELKIIYTKKSN
jgi:hypothetical protein